MTNLQTTLSSVRAQHSTDLGELHESRRRVEALAARTAELEQANRQVEARVAGVSRDLVEAATRDEQEVTNTILNWDRINLITPRLA